MNNLKGTGVALVTPFKKDKSVDYKSLEKLINFVSNNGVDYLVVMGTTAENPTLSIDEKDKIIKFVIKINNKKLPIVLGVGGYDTKAVIEKLKNINNKDISAILSVAPYYNKPNQNGLFEHFSEIAKNSKLPIILYNVPGRTGVNILPNTVIKLASKHKNIISVKEASGNIDQIMQIIKQKPSNFNVISGDDSLTLALISVGVSGVISVVANALPKKFSEMVNFALNGNFDDARKIHYKLLEFSNLIFAEGSPAGIKYSLNKLKIIENYLRLPLVPISKELENKINTCLNGIK